MFTKEGIRTTMPAVIAVTVLVGYFGLLFTHTPVPDTVNVLIVAVVSFFFGSHVNGVQTAALTQMANDSALAMQRTNDTPSKAA